MGSLEIFKKLIPLDVLQLWHITWGLYSGVSMIWTQAKKLQCQCSTNMIHPLDNVPLRPFPLYALKSDWLTDYLGEQVRHVLLLAANIGSVSILVHRWIIAVIAHISITYTVAWSFWLCVILATWRPGWQFNSIKKWPENLGPFFGCTFCPIESGLKFP